MYLPVAYLPRASTGPELNYLTTKKECLAVLYAIAKFRPYLYGRKFTLMNDHGPLKWIDSVKDPRQRLIRWRLKLQDYEYTFKYKPGKLNIKADALSRNPVENKATTLKQIEETTPRIMPIFTRQSSKKTESSSKPLTTTCKR